MATWKQEEGNRAACSLMTWKRKRNCADWSTVPTRRCSVADQIGPWLLYLLCCFHRGLRRRGAFVIRKPYRHVEVISRQTGLSLLPSPPFCPAAQEMLEGNWEEEKERQRGKHREKGESKLRFNVCLPSESFSSLINGSGPRARMHNWWDKWQEACRAGVCISVRVCRKIDLINVCVDWTLNLHWRINTSPNCSVGIALQIASRVYIWVNDK